MMIVCGYLGTLVELKVLERLPDRHYRGLFSVAMTLLALRTIWVWVKTLH